jgi:hypothetical protein
MAPLERRYSRKKKRRRSTSARRSDEEDRYRLSHSSTITSKLPRLDELLRHAWALWPQCSAEARAKLQRVRRTLLQLDAELQQLHARAVRRGAAHDAALVETLSAQVHAALGTEHRGGASAERAFRRRDVAAAEASAQRGDGDIVDLT